MEKQLPNTARLVMLLLAQGRNLKSICEEYQLSYEQYKRIANSDLFKVEQAKLTDQLREEAMEAASADPVLRTMREAGQKAAKLLVDEVGNFDVEGGASPSTRIKAAESILDRIGYTGKAKETDKTAAPVIVISASKATFVSEKLGIALAEKPVPAEAEAANG